MSSDESNTVEVEFQNRTFLDQKADNILIITRGHPFERDPFFKMIDSTGYPVSTLQIGVWTLPDILPVRLSAQQNQPYQI